MIKLKYFVTSTLPTSLSIPCSHFRFMLGIRNDLVNLAFDVEYEFDHGHDHTHKKYSKFKDHSKLRDLQTLIWYDQKRTSSSVTLNYANFLKLYLPIARMIHQPDNEEECGVQYPQYYTNNSKNRCYMYQTTMIDLSRRNTESRLIFLSFVYFFISQDLGWLLDDVLGWLFQHDFVRVFFYGKFFRVTFSWWPFRMSFFGDFFNMTSFRWIFQGDFG